MWKIGGAYGMIWNPLEPQDFANFDGLEPNSANSS